VGRRWGGAGRVARPAQEAVARLPAAIPLEDLGTTPAAAGGLGGPTLPKAAGGHGHARPTGAGRGPTLLEEGRVMK
jgi:hypothetical protein